MSEQTGLLSDNFTFKQTEKVACWFWVGEWSREDGDTADESTGQWQWSQEKQMKFRYTKKKDKVGASDVAQQIKALAVNPEDLNSIPGTL